MPSGRPPIVASERDAAVTLRHRARRPDKDPAAPVLVVTGEGSYWADATEEIRDLLAGRPLIGQR
jgi:hypothetical protein